MDGSSIVLHTRFSRVVFPAFARPITRIRKRVYLARSFAASSGPILTGGAGVAGGMGATGDPATGGDEAAGGVKEAGGGIVTGGGRRTDEGAVTTGGASVRKSGPVRSFTPWAMDRDRDRSTKVLIPQKTGPDRSRPLFSGLEPVWTSLGSSSVLTGSRPVFRPNKLKIGHVSINSIC
jgi:hypothetical protein